MAIPAPMVSVVIPNYNYLRYLPRRIESVLSQTYTDYEVILLDDASTDGSAEYLRGFEGHPKVSRVIINETNTGSPFKQWARGVEAARGRYVWIAEADDLAEPDFLERTVGLLETHPRMTLAMTMSELIDGEGRPHCRKYFEEFEPDGASVVYDGRELVANRMYYGNSCYNASMVLFRRDAWQSLPDREFLEMRYCGDWRLWVQLMMMGETGLVRSRLNSFRFHGKSVTDEGRSNAKGVLESHTVQLYILAQPDLLTHGQREVALYRMWRDYRRHRKHPREKTLYTESLTPEWLAEQGLTGRLRWMTMWTRAHALRWLRSTAVDINHRWPAPLQEYPEGEAPRAEG